MTLLTQRGKRWLKAGHVLIAVIWLLAGLTLLALLFLVRPGDDARIVSINETAKLIDDFIVIPAAAGTCLTALLLSLWRRQGIGTLWIIANWVIVVAAVLFGTFGLGPSLNALPPIARRLGMAALADPAYAHARTFLLVGAPLQVGALVVVLYLCVRKPWEGAARR